MDFLFVGLFGALGCMARYGVAKLLVGAGAWPWATLAVNALGAFLIGFIGGSNVVSGMWRVSAVVGFLGGFTTFSSYAWEVLVLGQSGRSWSAVGYAIASPLLCIPLAALGLWLVRLRA